MNVNKKQGCQEGKEQATWQARPSNEPNWDRKRKRGGGRGSGNIPPRCPNDAKMKFLKILKIIKEERLALDDLEDIPILKTEMGWTNLVKAPQKINLIMVNEFYHNIKSKTFMEEGILVRGVRVAFNLRIVNSFFQTQPLRKHSLSFPKHEDYQGIYLLK